MNIQIKSIKNEQIKIVNIYFFCERKLSKKFFMQKNFLDMYIKWKTNGFINNIERQKQVVNIKIIGSDSAI